MELVRPLQRRRRQATEEAVVEAPAPPAPVPANAVRVLHKFSGYGDFEGSVVSTEADGACSVKWDADGSITTLDQPRFERARRRYAEKHGPMPLPSSSGRPKKGAHDTRAPPALARGRRAPTPARTPTTQKVAPARRRDGVGGRGGVAAPARGRAGATPGDDSGAAARGGRRARASEAAGPDELEPDPRAPRGRRPRRHHCPPRRGRLSEVCERAGRRRPRRRRRRPRSRPVGTQVEARFGRGPTRHRRAATTRCRRHALRRLERRRGQRPAGPRAPLQAEAHGGRAAAPPPPTKKPAKKKPKAKPAPRRPRHLGTASDGRAPAGNPACPRCGNNGAPRHRRDVVSQLRLLDGVEAQKAPRDLG